MTGGYQNQGRYRQDTLLDDDVYKDLLSKGGLTSDVNAFTAQLGQVDLSPQSLMNSNNTAKTIRLIAKVNEMKNNNEMWKDAVTAAKTNGSYSELAIAQDGELFYKNSQGQIGTTTANEIKKDPTKFGNLLSVADLLYERQTNNGLAFDKTVFNIAENSVGLEKITKHIQELFGTLTEYSVASERHFSKDDVKKEYESLNEVLQKAGRKPTADEMKSLNILAQELNTPGDFVKREYKESRKGENPQAALKYIWSTLGDREKKKLEVIASLNGETSQSIVANMLQNYVGGTVEDKIMPEKLSKIKDINSKDDQKSLTNYQMFHNDKLRNPDMTFAFNDPKMNVLFRGAMGATGQLTTPDGEAIPMTTVSSVLNSGIGQIVKGNEVFFGGKKIDPSDLHNIIYDGQDAAKVYMPVGRNGAPDFDAFKKFKELYAVYEINKDNWSAKEAENYFNKEGYKLQIDERYEDGKKIKVIRENDSVKPFLIMYGYTNDATDLVKDNTDWLTKLSSQETNSVVPRLEQVWTVGKGKDSKNLTPNKFFNSEDYYKGMIAVPYRKESAAIVDAQVKQGPLAKQPTILDVQRNLYFSSQPANETWSAMNLKN